MSTDPYPRLQLPYSVTEPASAGDAWVPAWVPPPADAIDAVYRIDLPQVAVGPDDLVRVGNDLWQVRAVERYDHRAYYFLTPFWFCDEPGRPPSQAALFLAVLWEALAPRGGRREPAAADVRRRLVAAAYHGGVRDLPPAKLRAVLESCRRLYHAPDPGDADFAALVRYVHRETTRAEGQFAPDWLADDDTRLDWFRADLDSNSAPAPGAIRPGARPADAGAGVSLGTVSFSGPALSIQHAWNTLTGGKA
jgi:hypothetical protein